MTAIVIVLWNLRMIMQHHLRFAGHAKDLQPGAWVTTHVYLGLSVEWSHHLTFKYSESALRLLRRNQYWLLDPEYVVNRHSQCGY